VFGIKHEPELTVAAESAATADSCSDEIIGCD
jgi:hypothetical protein